MAPQPEDDAIAAVLAQYPIDGLRLVEPLEASKRNDNYIAEDAAGDRYVLRRYLRNTDEPRVRFQLEFQQRLHAAGYPTSYVVATAVDQPFALANDPWVLFSYIDGAEYDFERPAQAESAARALANFHLITDGFDIEDVAVAHNPTVQRWWTNGEEDLRALTSLFTGQDLDEELAFLCRWREELMRTWPLEQLEALPSGWLHGDFHGRNMVFRGDEVCGVFDFDVVSKGRRIEDVALALFMFAREFRGSTRVRPPVARRFLDAYDSVRPLAPEELEALPAAAVLIWAPSVAYHEMLQRAGEDSAAYFKRFVYLMQELGPEMERLSLELAGDLLEEAAAPLED